MTEQINIAEYGYKLETDVEISGRLVDELIDALDIVEKQETHMAFLDAVPEAVKKGEIQWNQHPSQEAFFSQTPQKIITYFGGRIMDLKFLLMAIKHKDIEDGVAVKKSELGQFKETANAELKLT